MHERGGVTDEQGEREGVAHDHQKHRQDHISDRGGEDGCFLPEQQCRKPPHAASASVAAETRRVKSRNTLSRSGLTSVSSDSAKPCPTIARASSAAGCVGASSIR